MSMKDKQEGRHLSVNEEQEAFLTDLSEDGGNNSSSEIVGLLGGEGGEDPRGS
jgi:hypothetical protein